MEYGHALAVKNSGVVLGVLDARYSVGGCAATNAGTLHMRRDGERGELVFYPEGLGGNSPPPPKKNNNFKSPPPPPLK